VWAKPERWAKLTPTVPSFSNFDTYGRWLAGDTSSVPTNAYDMTPGGFHAYEHQWAMGAAFAFHERMGRARVAARIRALNDQLKAGLAAMKNVTLHTPRDASLSAGIVALEVAGIAHEQVVAKLLERNIIASTAPYRANYVRLAPSLVNDEAEVEAALKAVRSIAGA
jgi:selenocysteine lyase/cysteine desulfurase